MIALRSLDRYVSETTRARRTAFDAIAKGHPAPDVMRELTARIGRQAPVTKG